jgi:hypothetical protein
MHADPSRILCPWPTPGRRRCGSTRRPNTAVCGSGGYVFGDGATLQDAADALVARLLTLAMSFRSGGMRISRELGPPDLGWFELTYELGEIAAAGGDIRDRVFGPGRIAA